MVRDETKIRCTGCGHVIVQQPCMRCATIDYMRKNNIPIPDYEPRDRNREMVLLVRRQFSKICDRCYE
jgi:hypothetical protein